MANVLDRLDSDDQTLALVHALAFVSRDTGGVRRASRSRRCAPTRSTSTACPTGTGDSSRRARTTRRNVCSPPRSARARRSLTSRRSWRQRSPTTCSSTTATRSTSRTRRSRRSATSAPSEAVDRAPDARAPDGSARSGRRSSPSGAIPTTSPRSCAEPRPRFRGAIAEGRQHLGGFDDVAGLGWRLLDDDPDEVVDALARCDAAPARLPSSSAGHSPTPRRCASSASTCRTTSATGTPCITRSPPRTRCTRRWSARRRPS